VRPTSDRVREALFAQLGALEDAHVLDLYAGTGALGIEALSRGASAAVFVERSPASLAVLRDNLGRLGLAAQSRIVRGDALAVVRRLGRSAERFDLILADPPYALEVGPALLGALRAARIVAPGGTVVIESSRRHPVRPVPGWRVVSDRRYGDTVLTRLMPEAGTGTQGDGPVPAPEGGKAKG
jgi:16S rRNA (guanine(966)-N(2))-methyltransferase RsmD